MSYQKTKPASGDRLNVSQSDIANNFTAIDTVNSVNHVAFNDTDQGKHKLITFPQQTVVAATYPPATSATEYALYNKTNGTAPALFVRVPGTAAGAGSSTTDFDITTLTSNPTTAIGSCTLPCGLIMKWGYFQINNGSHDYATVTFATAFPQHCLNVQVTGIGEEHGLYVYDITKTTFAVRFHALSYIYWFAIGD